MPVRGRNVRHLASIAVLLTLGLLAAVTPASAAAAKSASRHPSIRSCSDFGADRVGGADACAPTPDPYTHYYVLGASLTRVAALAIYATVPHVTVNAVDGRTWDSTTEITYQSPWASLWSVYESYVPRLRPKDWLVIENGGAGVSVARNREYMDKVIATLPVGVCLAWVIPHSYYVTQGVAATAVTRQWNLDMSTMIHHEIANVSCHALIEWDDIVTKATDSTPHLTASEIKAWAPYCYDGRHPSEAGRIAFAKAILAVLPVPRLVPVAPLPVNRLLRERSPLSDNLNVLHGYFR